MTGAWERTAETWKAEAGRLADSLFRTRVDFLSYVTAHESHRSWCNGGYEGGKCTCDLDKRINRIMEENS